MDRAAWSHYGVKRLLPGRHHADRSIADQSGTHIETIRYYERIGLMPEMKSMLQKSATRHSAAPGKAVALGLAAISSISFLVPTRTMAAEHPEERDLLLLEAGTAGQRELTQGTTYFGPTVGVEVEPIENWLEVELGAARFRNADATVWDLDMPFKKPWRLSQTLEVMPGVGPTWEHTSARGHADTWGAEAVIDLFFWHSKRFGWFVEPAYGVAFNAGRSKFFAITAGLFFTVL